MNVEKRSGIRVIAAVGAVAVLAATFAYRAAAKVSGRSAPKAPEAAVPAPGPVSVASLEVPCWRCPGSEGWAIKFRTNLDLIAPLGNGRANAAEWFKDFAKPDGSRAQEGDAAEQRLVPGPSGPGKILPAGDPLLREAEPWCDQASMRFYPDVFPVEGWSTQLPNLLLSLTFARSWVARGMGESSQDLAMADFQRAVRLGRLLRQDDVTIIQDVVGLACIRYGAQGIYDLVRRQGDLPRALAAAIVLGENAPQRLRTAELITKLSVEPWLRKGAEGAYALAIPDKNVEEIIALARTDPDRRFRGEAALELGIVRGMGASSQQRLASTALDEMAKSKDPILASVASWALKTKPTPEMLRDAFGW